LGGKGTSRRKGTGTRGRKKGPDFLERGESSDRKKKRPQVALSSRKTYLKKKNGKKKNEV